MCNNVFKTIRNKIKHYKISNNPSKFTFDETNKEWTYTENPEYPNIRKEIIETFFMKRLFIDDLFFVKKQHIYNNMSIYDNITYQMNVTDRICRNVDNKDLKLNIDIDAINQSIYTQLNKLDKYLDVCSVVKNMINIDIYSKSPSYSLIIRAFIIFIVKKHFDKLTNSCIMSIDTTNYFGTSKTFTEKTLQISFGSTEKEYKSTTSICKIINDLYEIDTSYNTITIINIQFI
jgi:hypothetical protein